MKPALGISALLPCLLVGFAAPSALSAAEEHANLLRDAHAAARRKDGAAILRSVRELYRGLDWFSADGETVCRMKLMTTTSLAFSMKLGRPDRYLVSWGRQKTQVNGAPADVDDSGQEIDGAVWNAGAGPYNYARQFGAYARAQSDETARAMATGISQGVANSIPSLFFGGPGKAADIEIARLEGTEAIDGEECWVISGPSRVSEKETVWISTRRLVVRQYRRSVKPPADAQRMLDLGSDEKIDEGLGAAGLDKTPENRAQFKAMMEMAQVMMKHRDALDGTVTEIYRNVRLHGASGSGDFEFHVPAGTPLRASLLGGAASSAEPEPPLRAAAPGEGARALLARVVARYRGLKSFSADGKIISSHRFFGNQLSETQGFSLRLGRPNLYRITWSSARRSAGGDVTVAADDRSPDGALWNAGEGAFQYERLRAAYAKAGDDRFALGVAAGVAAGVLPGVVKGVLPLFEHSAGWFTELNDPVLEGAQTVQGEDCYVVSASSLDWVKHTLWISRERLLILQHRHVSRRPPDQPGERRQFEEHALEDLKHRGAPAANAGLEMMADLQKAMADHADVYPGDTTEVYRNLRVDEAVEPSDFVFEVPEGTVLKKSLLDGVVDPPGVKSSPAEPPR